jgi:ribosomal 50S subunit-recycling heat shock protein
MRVDLLMNKLCLVKSRNIAKNACDRHLVLINGVPVKASNTVNEGDIIAYSIYGYQTTIKLLKVPAGNVAKKSAGDYYEIISRDKLETAE